MIKSINVISVDELIETYRLFVDVIIKMFQMWIPLFIVAIVFIVVTEIVLRLINRKLDRMVEIKRRKTRS